MLLLILLLTFLSSDILIKKPGDIVIYDFNYSSDKEFNVKFEYDIKELYCDYILFINSDGTNKKIRPYRTISVPPGMNNTFSIVIRVKTGEYIYKRPISTSRINLETNYHGNFKIFSYIDNKLVTIKGEPMYVTTDIKENKILNKINVNYK